MSIKNKTINFVKENKTALLLAAGAVTVIVITKKKRHAGVILQKKIRNGFDFPLDMSIPEIKAILTRRENVVVHDALLVTTKKNTPITLYIREAVKGEIL